MKLAERRARQIEDWHASRFFKYVPSEYDLAPCYVKPGVTPSEAGYRDDGGYALVCVYPVTNAGLYKVYVWGADDLGFESKLLSPEEALKVFNSVDWVYGCPDGFEYC
jgi:hypothetical protein